MSSKLFPLIITLVLLTIYLTSCSAGEKAVVVSQEIAVTLLPERHEVEGVSTIVLRPGRASQFSFIIAPNATVAQTLVDGKPVPFTFVGGVLSIDLHHAPTRKEINLEVRYRCEFNDQPPTEAITGEDPTYGVNAVVSKRGVFLGPGAEWYPSPTIMPGKRIVRVTAPAGIEAITAGKRISHETSDKNTTSIWEEARPIGDLSLSASAYLIRGSSLQGIPIYTYLTPASADYSRRYLDASARYISFYESLFGPYPFEKFAVVENFFPTGSGFPSYTLLGSTIIHLPFIPDTSLPHEIAHCWWGNGVLVDEREGNWSEGLVTYISDYFLQERKSPQAGREYRSIALSDFASLVTTDRDFPLREFTRRIDPASRSIGYGKGMMIFHMIRKKVGDEVFFRALREISREKLFTKASWGDFLDRFSRLSGKDFSRYRREWLNRGGGPHLSFSGVTSTRNKSGWTVSGEISQTEPVYHLPLAIELETESGKIRQTLSIDRKTTPFAFTVSALPRRLILDPDADIFRVLSQDEISPTINRIKGSRSLVVVVMSNYKGDKRSVELLLESLGQQGAAKITENEATGERIAGHDILICGVPQRWRIVDGLSQRGFVLDGESFNHPEDALFMVTRNPADKKRVAAIFLPLSAKGCKESVPKITHYGKYSYLAFRGGENKVKGIADVVSSGVSAIDFDSGKE